MLRTIIIAAFAVFCLSYFGGNSASACTKHDCNRTTSGHTYHGTDTKPNLIKVTVCHGYWNQLNVGTYRGRRTRWWEPVIVKDGWKSTVLPTNTTECVVMWRRYGEQVSTYASCVRRLIWTAPITRSRTYIMH
jgi:hypothetical protein